jgi:RND family efflux transporter MFP subunit
MKDQMRLEQEETLEMKDNKTAETAEIERAGHSAAREGHEALRKILILLLCLLILGAGIAGATYFKKTTPKARKRPPVATAPLVEVEKVYPGMHVVMVPAMGTVIPSRELMLKARVSGEIVGMSPEFVEGGFLAAGEEILRIEPADYELAVVQKQSQVAEATYALKLEMGYQDVAKREWELLEGGKEASEMDIELALRRPHLEKAKADLSAARAELDQARLDLERTRIHSPFNAIVLTKSVEKGSYVSAKDSLAELLCTDEYWIRVSLPVDRLKWISIPKNGGERGSRARISYRNGSELSGRVIKLMGDLETEGRMARVLVSVKDPLGLKTKRRGRPPLLIGEYVSLKLEGRRLENIFPIPRAALRDNTSIWIAGDDGKLRIRHVGTVWRNEQTVLVKDGLKPGDSLIISDLPAPVDGMSVKVQSSRSDSGNKPLEGNNSISKGMSP